MCDPLGSLGYGSSTSLGWARLQLEEKEQDGVCTPSRCYIAAVRVLILLNAELRPLTKVNWVTSLGIPSDSIVYMPSDLSVRPAVS
jgi:hypothetical protein